MSVVTSEETSAEDHEQHEYQQDSAECDAAASYAGHVIASKCRHLCRAGAWLHPASGQHEAGHEGFVAMNVVIELYAVTRQSNSMAIGKLHAPSVLATPMNIRKTKTVG